MKDNQWLKIRPLILCPPRQPETLAIEFKLCEQRSDGVYAATLATPVTEVPNGFSLDQIESILQYLAAPRFGLHLDEPDTSYTPYILRDAPYWLWTTYMESRVAHG